MQGDDDDGDRQKVGLHGEGIPSQPVSQAWFAPKWVGSFRFPLSLQAQKGIPWLLLVPLNISGHLSLALLSQDPLDATVERERNQNLEAGSFNRNPTPIPKPRSNGIGQDLIPQDLANTAGGGLGWSSVDGFALRIFVNFPCWCQRESISLLEICFLFNILSRGLEQMEEYVSEAQANDSIAPTQTPRTGMVSTMVSKCCERFRPSKVLLHPSQLAQNGFCNHPQFPLTCWFAAGLRISRWVAPQP